MGQKSPESEGKREKMRERDEERQWAGTEEEINEMRKEEGRRGGKEVQEETMLLWGFCWDRKNGPEQTFNYRFTHSPSNRM